MKKFEAFRCVRDEIHKKHDLMPNDANSCGLYSVFDMETEVYNPPFSSDDLSALHVFVNACISNPDIHIALHKIGVFDTKCGVLFDWDRKFCDSEEVREIIKEYGGIEE